MTSIEEITAFKPIQEYWRYSEENEKGNVAEITGDVVEITFEQHKDYVTKKLAYDNYNEPIYDINIYIKTSKYEEKIWGFTPDSKNRASVAFQKALIKYDNNIDGFYSSLGLNITVKTPPAPEGKKYGQGMARPFEVVVNGKGKSQIRKPAEKPKELQAQEEKVKTALTPQLECEQAIKSAINLGVDKEKIVDMLKAMNGGSTAVAELSAQNAITLKSVVDGMVNALNQKGDK